MADLRVSVTLTFDTDTPPPALAMAVGQAVTAQVPDHLTGIDWYTFDLDDETEGAGG
ncbi:hypothetical protein [Streptomyces sp. CRN 30]|uniref:hypothetical protein n=1 Tax=Streptomyces sp. CRN 30 TaxID=3075613 RepID=UPI002A83E864|nr:hypothetical protein [Streptomyces sp. CRN 30]